MPLVSIAGNDDNVEQLTPHDSVEDIQLADVLGQNIAALDDLKVTTVHKPMDVDASPIVEPTRNASISTTADHTSDITSINSMPAVHITEPSSPMRERESPTSTEATMLSTAHRPPPPSPSRSSTMQEESTQPVTSNQRRARHRSAMEPRSNRLSGFFTNLMHRREPPTPTVPTDPIREDAQPSEPAVANSEEVSRVSSPVPPARPTTPPPPSLPPPSLQELGLSLSALTSELAPSHFSTPPASGAFLAPHYLLLCHAQGLDVLPLVSPPAMQPYALVRRVSFKSVVIMEQRGVLVAIAGRRDGVRVYALEEIKKAIEWRIDVEVRRERDKQRRENTKKSTSRIVESFNDISRDSNEKNRKASLSTPPPGEPLSKASLIRKNSQHDLPVPSSPPPVPLIPRSATRKTVKKRVASPSVSIPANPPQPSGQPPPYAGPSEVIPSPVLASRQSFLSIRQRTRGTSVSNVLAHAPTQRISADQPRDQDDSKADWADSSDDEAIDAVASGPSGTHLDERTSATLSAATGRAIGSPQLLATSPQAVPVPVPSRSPTQTTIRRNRPSNLDLTLARSTAAPPPEPSPAPTLLTLQQALSNDNIASDPNTPFVEHDDDEEEVDGHITLAQALLESRIPDLPPAGTTRPQEPIFITPTASTIPRPETTVASDSRSSISRNSGGGSSSANNNRRRRRWSVMISSPSTETANEPPATAPASGNRSRFTRSNSFRSLTSQTPTQRSVTEPVPALPPTSASAALDSVANTPVPPEPPTSAAPSTSRSSRFLPRLLNHVLHGRSSDERPALTSSPVEASDGNRWSSAIHHQTPPPKLEYVKLPGTKGALLIKAVETAKKSFLAILCGESGEKVELFAGTYRTALGLSRTFILPDSPRSLELQLQGDDLVEVFLVFAQNVFGLEPATVRVREVRIGRAERRAARRRARENRVAGNNDGVTNDAEGEDETNVNVSIGVSVPVASASGGNNSGERSSSPTLVASEHPDEDRTQTPEPAPTSSASATQSEEVLLLATAQMGPYTTFQQLNFPPRFPLASIADEYVIPPTYPSVLEYKAQHEAEGSEDSSPNETTQTEPPRLPVEPQPQPQFTPPGLPVPTQNSPSKWYYRDPKNVVHGPWKSSLMQAWYKDGLLPPDLPVRGEDDTEYILLRDLRLRCVDPSQPFRNYTPPAPLLPPPPPEPVVKEKPLLSPISLLTQPKHFGPPALFFSSRGGHSTSIVDSRGRSVLKGKFLWSNDDDATKSSLTGRLGDIKRLEAFDTSDRSVLVAMRQGGLEVVDLGDALLKPADESRTTLPNYAPPQSSIARRAPFVWKIGTPLASSASMMSDTISVKGKGTFGHSSGKKMSTSSAKYVNSRADTFGSDSEMDQQDEVLYLGRKEDEVYFCERNAASFRILRLSPS
ncbi:hypothetical protein CPB83DRAFT_842496 [Crepidotus variabilis]|uniref:GYF domain-containing protein n=1 Tax=Crepidotus variabilis TaxID=179855 RepID=A0A9P6EVF8_9AGAR|nr:hypothetical protein CPB83DRAFT_842496 [Crepidotus variabilis]